MRKILGGGMRQAGFLAAAGIYALQNHIERLKDDHTHAKQIACALQKKNFIKMFLPVETNLIIFEMNDTMTAPAFVEKLKEKNILGIAITPSRVRLVVHLDITKEMVHKTVEIIDKL